ncbi:Oidioi.mRNA.OKI2018_I69.XSR.g15942.t1.cds [Oikopleura dioica]|uniref:Oidioi.mRNA.OKI2018_I69.XSR.g15942.t1.cds n=1 Tax=Oikopleura dioica TaxID=34765 RepID=A0ABN7SEG5_OIKDI|nr:Oidioi.mRNA.OKI2018_I69.XSR.g15942.t1.cds [Oikopleura dioica]
MLRHSKRFSSLVTDRAGKQWKISVAALINRRPLLTESLDPEIAFLFDHSIEAQSRDSCLSEWEKVANDQEQMIKDKAAGKILGELPFSESKTNIRDRKQLVLNAHLDKELNFQNSSFKAPHDELVLVDKNGQLPKINLDPNLDALELAQKASESTGENIEISFTSPYPTGHYEVVFDEKRSSEENCFGEKVFIYHGMSGNIAIFAEKSVLGCEEVNSAVRRLKETAGFECVEFTTFDDVRENQAAFDGDDLIFLVEDFSGPLFESILRNFTQREPKITIFGKSYFLYVCEDRENEGIKYSRGRHIFNTALLGKFVVVGGGPRSTNNKSNKLCKYMGAQVKDQISLKIDYLFTTNMRTKKYVDASKFNVPIYKRELIFDIWEKRKNPNFFRELSENKEDLDKWRPPPFEDYKMRFMGFPDDEAAQLQEELMNHGGRMVHKDDPDLDLIVIPNDMPKPVSISTDDLEKMVVVEWFWSCIQVGYRLDSAQYPPSWYGKVYETMLENTEYADESGGVSLIASPNRLNVSKSGETRYELLRDLALKFGITDAEIDDFDDPQKPVKSRRSLLTAVVDGVSKKRETGKDDAQEKIEKARVARKFICSEISTVEKNYVKILQHIISEYKSKLEEARLIPEAECKQIFGNLAELCNIHTEMNDAIEGEMNNWSDETQLGQMIGGYGDRLLKEYPPYINYLEHSLEKVKSLTEKSTKFRAFLKSTQARSTYKFDLVDMLTRPVQHLPRYLLLLKDLKAKTEVMNKDHKDIEHLDKALEIIHKVTKTVNQARGKAEDQFALIDLLNNEIDKCPMYLISAQRRIVARYNCVGLDASACLGTKLNDKLCVILFNDILMICQRRSSRKVRRQPSDRGATPGRGTSKKEALEYKIHFSLTKVVNVLRVKETSEVQRCISIAILLPINHKEQLSLFTHQIGKDEDKESILTTLCDTIIKDRDGDREMMKDIISETELSNLNINLKEINQSGATTAKKIKLTMAKGLKKFSSRAHLEPSEPNSLTAADRYDSDASLASISSNISLVQNSTGLPYNDTPSKYKSPLKSGFSTVRGILSGSVKKKNRPSKQIISSSNFESLDTQHAFQPPKSLPPRPTKK